MCKSKREEEKKIAILCVVCCKCVNFTSLWLVSADENIQNKNIFDEIRTLDLMLPWKIWQKIIINRVKIHWKYRKKTKKTNSSVCVRKNNKKKYWNKRCFYVRRRQFIRHRHKSVLNEEGSGRKCAVDFQLRMIMQKK